MGANGGGFDFPSVKKAFLKAIALAVAILASPVTSAQLPTPSPEDQALLAEFYKRGLVIHDDLVNERVAAIVHEQFNDDRAAFEKTLQKQGYTETTFRILEREKIAVQAMRYLLKKEETEGKPPEKPPR